MTYVLIGLPLWFVSLWVLLRANRRAHQLPRPRPISDLNTGIQRWHEQRILDDQIESLAVTEYLSKLEKTLQE